MGNTKMAAVEQATHVMVLLTEKIVLTIDLVLSIVVPTIVLNVSGNISFNPTILSSIVSSSKGASMDGGGVSIALLFYIIYD